MLHSLSVNSFAKVRSLSTPDPNRLRYKEWLEAIMAEKRLSPIQLAKNVGVSPTTIYRALDPDGEFTPTMKTLLKISNKTGATMPGGHGHHPRSYDIHEVEHFRPKSAALKHLMFSDLNLFPVTIEENRKRSQEVYQVMDRALDLEGYLPGDIVVVDPAVQPRPGDIVCAVVDKKVAEESEILRRFEPPYLISRSLDRLVEPAPILLDRTVHIKGTVTSLIRNMRAAS